MYRRFKIEVSQNKWSNYLSFGQKVYNTNKEMIQKSLSKFVEKDNSLSAKDIMDNWFPDVKADIFISHSHKDRDLALSFAGWLEDKFGLKSFIDSTVWGYSDILLKLIDKEYCKKRNGNYDYDMRNRSTSHVHMMLSTSLMRMIDKTECILFIETQNSFTPCEYLKEKGETGSPWIYNELTMTEMLRIREPERSHKVVTAMDSCQESLNIKYPSSTTHLKSLSQTALNRWQCNWSKGKARHPLDLLYISER